MILKNLFKRFTVLSLIIATVITPLASCNKNNDNPDDKEPGDPFSGSIVPDSDKKDEETTAPPADEGDENATYYISTPSELLAMKRKGTYILTANIDLSGSEWSPVGTYASPFIGTLDGAGFTISGLKIHSAGKDSGDCLTYSYQYIGLFGCTDGATVKNLKLSDIDINVSSSDDYRVIYAGALVGLSNDTQISDCELISGSISANSSFFKAYSGGLIGYATATSVKSCKVSATVSASNRGEESSTAGGAIAYMGVKSSISACTVNGSVTASSSKGIAYSGGICGYCYNSSVIRTTSNASVTAKTDCNDSEKGYAGASFAGGIAAYSGGFENSLSSISLSVATGAVTADSVDFAAYAGGITAKQGYTSVSECYSVSAVSAESDVKEGYVGGLCAFAASANTVNGVFFSGSLTVSAKKDDAYCGVLIGFDSTRSSEQTDKFKLKIEKCAYLQLSALPFSINGITYASPSFKPEFITVHGTEYTLSLIRNKNTLIDSLAWSADNWNFSMNAFPTVKL